MKEEMIELYVLLLIAIMTMMQWLIERNGCTVELFPNDDSRVTYFW